MFHHRGYAREGRGTIPRLNNNRQQISFQVLNKKKQLPISQNKTTSKEINAVVSTCTQETLLTSWQLKHWTAWFNSFFVFASCVHCWCINCNAWLSTKPHGIYCNITSIYKSVLTFPSRPYTHTQRKKVLSLYLLLSYLNIVVDNRDHDKGQLESICYRRPFYIEKQVLYRVTT